MSLLPNRLHQPNVSGYVHQQHSQTPPRADECGDCPARGWLGPTALRLLFARVAGPAGTPDTPGVFYRGLRVATVDGFTLDLPDTPQNAEHFGRGGNGSGSGNPYPQLQALLLAESGTRSLLGAAYGPCSIGEKSLALDLLPALGPGMLVLADRNFISWKLWSKAAATGADLCWRVSASFNLKRMKVLPDGTYLTRLAPQRRKDGDPVTVRIIEYTVTTTDSADGKHEVSELFALATTLLDPAQAPAGDLADLYHRRWQAETGIGDLKTAQRGGPEAVLRSKSPAMVEQELYAMLCVYQGIRDLIGYAAPTGLDPGRVSFAKAIDAARDTVTRAALPPAAKSRALAHVVTRLTAKANLVRKRPGRSSPRARKRGGSHRYPRRPDHTPAVRTVTHTITIHRLQAQPSP